MRCDIIIPVWNKLKLTRQCVESIAKNTHAPYRIIAIDNASKAPTRQYLESLKQDGRFEFLLIRNEENMGYPPAANQGIRASDAEYVCILNNDTLVMDGWLGEMIKVAQAREDIGIVNPGNNFGRKKPFRQTYEDYARRCTAGKKGAFSETASPVGFCYLIKREVIGKIGLWDETFSPGYFEDTEYAVRAKKAGYNSVFANGAFVWHIERSSFKKRGFNKLFRQSEERFYSRFKRPGRILYVLTEPSDKYYASVRKGSYDAASGGSWVRVYLKKSAPKITLERHTYISRFFLKDAFFQANVIFRVLKKKKKFSKIITDSVKLKDRLLSLKKIHKAEVQVL